MNGNQTQDALFHIQGIQSLNHGGFAMISATLVA